MSEALKHARNHQVSYLEELIEFLGIPSVSTQPQHDPDCRAAAEWLVRAMDHAGLHNVKIIETKGQPLVYADWMGAGSEAPTVLIYGHYDVQPAEPFDLWETPPFAPEIRENYVYARGASDDKGPLYAHIKAVASYLEHGGRLPVNVRFIVEGEEESGGASLETFVPKNKELLAADVAVVSDTPILRPDQPSIVYALRGICYMLIDVTGPAHDLHSGSYGGGVDNPLNVLGHVIARLKDENGRILIPGFYDRVRPLQPEERRLLAQLPFDEDRWLKLTGAPALWGERDYTLIERLGARPTLDVHGIIGGYTGPGGKTVLPSTVHAKISMRLVPDQDPDEIADLFINYVQRIAPETVTVKITSNGGAPASITDVTIPAMKAAAAAYAGAFGSEPVYMREGGSIPVVSLFQSHLGLETVLMGFGLPDDRIHSPNERLYLPNFYRGIETSIRFLAEYADLHRKSG